MKARHKNVVIFGASQGIGSALAIEYAARGANLILLSRNTDSLKQIKEKNPEYVIDFQFCDITNKNDVASGIDFAVEKLSTIDLVIINSGKGGPNWMNNFNSGEFIKLFEVNTFGIAYVLELILPVMRKQGYGTIAGVTSLADIRGYAGSSSYSASKAAASILLEAARVELKKENIYVVTVRPGFTKTEMTDKNEFYMPFLKQPEEAAKILWRGIEKRKSVVQFPFFTVNATRIIKNIPNWIYDFGMTIARPRKKNSE